MITLLAVTELDYTTTTNYQLPTTNCKASFTVAIDAPASSDISFNWWIIQLQ